MSIFNLNLHIYIFFAIIKIKRMKFMAVTNTLAKADAPALYDMINNGTALTSSTLATGDYIAIGDVSNSTGAKITVNNLANFLKNNYTFVKGSSWDLFYIKGYNIKNSKDPSFYPSHTTVGNYPIYYTFTETLTSSGNYDHTPIPYTFSMAPYLFIFAVCANFNDGDQNGPIWIQTPTKLIHGSFRVPDNSITTRNNGGIYASQHLDIDAMLWTWNYNNKTITAQQGGMWLSPWIIFGFKN